MGHRLWRPPILWMIAATIFVAAALQFHRMRPCLARLFPCAALVAAGALAIQNGSNSSVTTALWLGDGEPVVVTAHVVTDGNVEQDDAGAERQALDVETERLESGNQARELRFGVRLHIYAKGFQRYGMEDEAAESSGRSVTLSHAPNMRPLQYGQRIRFTARLNAPRNFRNPGAFDFAGYLRDRGIYALASAKRADVQVLPGFSGNAVALLISRIHRSIVMQVHRVWSDEVAGLMDALLIGERAFLDRPTRVDFQRTGTYHMLVVSGLHVGVLAICVFWLFRRFGLGELVTSVLAVLVIFLYAAVTREGTPVWRAALMFAVYLFTRFMYRHRAVLNALGGVALAMLVVNPRTLFSASFQMSFLCVVLIAGVAVPILERTVQPYARGLRMLDTVALDRALAPRVAQFRIDVRLIAQRLQPIAPYRVAQWSLTSALRALFWGVDLLLLSAVMQAGMALPMAYYFHRTTSVGIAANLLAIPLLQIFMPASVAAVVLSYVSIALAHIPAFIAEFSLKGIAGSIHSLAGLHFADLRVPTPAIWVILLSGAAILTCVTLMRRRTIVALGGLALLLASTLCLWMVRPQERLNGGMLELTAIDVGQGDSLLVVSPEGRKLLVDGGGLPLWIRSRMEIGEDVVSPYLWTRGISRIDAIALTHAHADHMAGLPAIIANFRPTELWLPEGVPKAEIRRLLRVAADSGVQVIYRRAGDTVLFGGAMVRVLAPDPEFPVRSGHRNDESLIMKVSFGSTAMLLEADAEKGTEALVASQHAEADVLKVAHNGSASATSAEFLRRVHPRFAVISVGARNVYRHPRPEVLRRLQEAGVKTYRTDTAGATSFLLDGRSVTAPASPH